MVDVVLVGRCHQKAWVGPFPRTIHGGVLEDGAAILHLARGISQDSHSLFYSSILVMGLRNIRYALKENGEEFPCGKTFNILIGCGGVPTGQHE